MTEATAAAPGSQAGRVLTDGEQWTADALTALRADRLAPRAVAWFLRESLDRATETRARRGQLARQARLWSLGGAGAAFGLRETLALRGVGAPSRHALVSWCAVDALMLDWHLGMVQEQQGERSDALTGRTGAVRRSGAP